MTALTGVSDLMNRYKMPLNIFIMMLSFLEKIICDINDNKNNETNDGSHNG